MLIKSLLKKILWKFLTTLFFITTLLFSCNPHNWDKITPINSPAPTGNLPFITINRTIEDNTVDLGQQLTDLLEKEGGINVQLIVKLRQNTIFSWDVPVVIKPDYKLYVYGEGYTNNANNISVIIRMTKQLSWEAYGKIYKRPGRLEARSRSDFSLVGVEIRESLNDSRELTLSNGCALFEIANSNFASITLSQIRLTVTEDIVNIHGWSYGLIKFGHTYVSKGDGKAGSVYLVRANSGNTFTGNGGIISDTKYITLNSGIELIPENEKNRFIILN